MKYYCKNCGTIIPTDVQIFIERTPCPICALYCAKQDSELVKVPDYETPRQYEARTGKAYPENGAVWAKSRSKSLGWAARWAPYRLKDVSLMMKMRRDDLLIVTAGQIVPPPEDWEPKEEIC
jgi:hypothetical protein